MLRKTRGIVLHTYPYNDKYAIVQIYTEAFGRAAYLVARTRGKRSSVSKALFLPLSVVEMEVDHQPKRELHRIREAKSHFPLVEIFCHPVKNALALFVAEMLLRVVRETEPDERLFEFLIGSIRYLEMADQGIANFHIVFLLRLLHYLGIYPNLENYEEGTCFDLLNGIFTRFLPLHHHYLDANESLLLSRLSRISYENMSLYAFSRQDRVRILRRIIDYYRLHLPEFPAIKSLEILQSLFD